MADRINVEGAASTLRYLDNDFKRMNIEIMKMLDNLKYLQDNFYGLPDDVTTQKYSDIAQSIFESNGLIEIQKKVHKWCQQVDQFVQEEERQIIKDKLEEEENRRRELRKATSKSKSK